MGFSTQKDFIAGFINREQSDTFLLCIKFLRTGDYLGFLLLNS